MMGNGNALPTTTAPDLVAIGSTKVDGSFFKLSYLYPFQSGEQNKIPPTLGNMPLSGYYA